MAGPKVSTITCAHNPRTDYLEEVLNGLKGQTLSQDYWEFILIDNASTEALDKCFDLSWHANARHLHEPTLGLTAARHCGIREAQGDLLIFVDDDNVLSGNYVEEALRIYQEFSRIGVFGGHIEARYDVPAPEWVIPSEHLLAVRACLKDIWSNCHTFTDSMPCGAGICIHASIAREYVKRSSVCEIRKGLGRKGSSLAGGEDFDMVYTAIDLGFGTGRFASMYLTHLIPESRINEDYMIRLAESSAESMTYLRALRPETRIMIERLPSLRQRLFAWLRSRKMHPIRRRIYLAGRAGYAKAFKKLEL